jgi:hypothetical protein
MDLRSFSEKAKKGEIKWEDIEADYSRKRVEWVERNKDRLRSIIQRSREDGLGFNSPRRANLSHFQCHY